MFLFRIENNRPLADTYIFIHLFHDPYVNRVKMEMKPLVRLQHAALSMALLFLFIVGGNVRAEPAELTIKAQMGMKYDTLRFQVSPGQTVKIELVNVDEIPHNIVFTESGKRLSVVKAVEEMGAKASSSGYLPDLDPILAGLPVIDGGEKKTLTFTAPKQAGVYPYVCTFPGHGYTMYGAMYVGDQDLPSLNKDPHVPDQHVDEGKAKDQEKPGEGLNLPHAFTARRPFVYRIKMPDATQAAIAVALRNGQNYCWDAGRHRLRYAWNGGFVDPMPNFSGKGHETANIKGDIYYRSGTYPLRIGGPDQLPEQRDFEGYRMVEGRPVFHVSLDGVQVKHHVIPLPEGNGIVRRFRVNGVKEPVWFVSEAEGEVTLSSPDGSFDEKGQLKLSPEEARDFRVRVTQEASGDQ